MVSVSETLRLCVQFAGLGGAARQNSDMSNRLAIRGRRSWDNIKKVILREEAGNCCQNCKYRISGYPWSEPAIELYRPSDHRLSAK
jgi:hypothetical protein